jgi:AraC-like DNA-binding protein
VAKEQVKFQLKLTSIQDQLKKSESTLGNRFAEMLQEQRNSLLAEIAG